MIRIKYIQSSSVLLFCNLTLFPGVGYAHGGGHHEQCEEEFHWTQQKSEAANILAQVAGPGMIQHVVQVSGKIGLHPDHLAYAIPKVEGIVREIYKNVGDKVETGEVIALIESNEIASAKAAYLAAEKKSHAQRAALQREAKLRRISAEQDYLDAQLAAEEASIHAGVALQYLYALGFSQQEIEKLAKEDPKKFRFYQLRAPLTGKVVERNMTLGESVEPATKVFTIANFDKVWVEINVAANEAHFLKEGLPVEISSANGKKAQAQVCHFNPTISEETRKATAIAVLENNIQKWRPGEFITAHIQAEQTPAPVVIPREAVQQIKGEACVFVENAETGFAPRPVKLGKMDGINVEVITGLKPGDSYAACNTFCLKADYEKAEAEHHH